MIDRLEAARRELLSLRPKGSRYGWRLVKACDSNLAELRDVLGHATPPALFTAGATAYWLESAVERQRPATA